MTNSRLNYTVDMRAIGARIRLLRKRKSLTMEKMAETFDVSYQTISKWERGYSVPDLTNIGALKRYFDVSADYILFGDDLSAAA